ncbi:MAG TPA: vanadium-dependent haloperoxidase [Flavitalea sp.]|nr:vanadium-dependent haloperoxidase [Flavitalea sp.]
MLSSLICKILFIAGISATTLTCTKNHISDRQRLADAYSSEVVVKWLDMQLNMLRVPLAEGVGSQAADRAQAYCGIALYESILPGMPARKSLHGQLTDFPAMPVIEAGKKYIWGAVANAALAEMNRKLFPKASATSKSGMDSLEKVLLLNYSVDADSETLQRSVAFGKEVSSQVYAWAATDGSANTNPPHVASGKPGTWVSTPPNFPGPVHPYADQRRLLAPGSAAGTTLDPPPPYSDIPASPFYNMVKDVYDKSQALTPEQKAMAIYHRDVPGYPGGGQFVAVLSQVLNKAKPKLDVAAVAYAKCGIAQSDATTICFTFKYSFNIVRPITYIRKELGHPSWNALFNTPGHPEFPAAHAVVSSAIAEVLSNVFGENFKFTLSSYDYLGLPARNYNSFKEMSKEMADSRVYGGIHYQASCDKGRMLGEKVSKNIISTVKF